MIAYELMRENHMKTYENEILIWESYDLIVQRIHSLDPKGADLFISHKIQLF